jgi:hypothetical protein
MGYQKIAELSAKSISMRSAEGEMTFFDQVVPKNNLKETFRLELHKELCGLAASEAVVAAPGLIQYRGLERFEAGYYLIRKDTAFNLGVTPYQALDLTEMVATLAQIVRIMDAYHAQGMVLGGLSPGLLCRDTAGTVWLQDPPVLNYLGKLLDGDYEYSLPAEVIKGAEWGREADVFSWGELAYRLLVGQAPFAAVEPGDRVAKVLEGLIIDPRNRQPRLSEQFSKLIVDCLTVDARRRPTTEELLRRLDTLIAGGQSLVSPEEAVLFRDRAAQGLKKQQQREHLKLWLRKYGITLMVTVGVIAVLCLTVFSPRRTTLTPKTTPLQVVNYYFQAIKTVNVSLLGETVHRAKNDLADTLSNIHVINASRKAYEMKFGGGDAIQVKVVGLKLVKEEQSATAVTYRAAYTVKFVMAEEIQHISRRDRFRLTPVRRIWRITDIAVLKEKRWSEKRRRPEVRNEK